MFLELLRQAGHEAWLERRHDEVKVKGKGFMKTYFLRFETVSTAESDSFTPSTMAESEVFSMEDDEACKMERLVEWNVEVMSDLLKVRSDRGVPFIARVFKSH